MADVMFFLCSTSRGATSAKIRKARTMHPTNHPGSTVKAGFVKGHVKLYRKHSKKPSKGKKARGAVNVASLAKRTKR